jgi:hypothetical protein
VALLTTVGFFRLQGWAKLLAYFFAAALTLGWIYAVWQVVRWEWPYGHLLGTMLSLIPGILLLVLCAGGAWPLAVGGVFVAAAGYMLAAAEIYPSANSIVERIVYLESLYAIVATCLLSARSAIRRVKVQARVVRPLVAHLIVSAVVVPVSLVLPFLATIIAKLFGLYLFYGDAGGAVLAIPFFGAGISVAVFVTSVVIAVLVRRRRVSPVPDSSTSES